MTMNQKIAPPTPFDHVRVRILPDGRMSRAHAARYLGMKPKTLAMWQMNGKGPRSLKVGGRRYYFKKNLDEFILGEEQLLECEDATPESLRISEPRLISDEAERAQRQKITKIETPEVPRK